MQVNSFIDWLACTLPNVSSGVGDCVEWGLWLTFTERREWFEGKPRNGYRFAASHTSGYQVLGGRPDMGTHFIVPGHALQEGRTADISAEGMINLLLSRNGKFTRLDLAVDATDSNLHIDDLARDVELGRATSAARRWNYVIAPNGGQCLYIGSRTSELFCRVYNKASEQAALANKPEAADWKRIELECKGMAARGVATRIRQGARMDAVAADNLRAFVDFPGNREWAKILGAANVQIARSHRKLGDTEKWLLGAVARSVARRIKADPTFKERFQAMVRSYLDDDNRD
jgi:hypothetical protein